MFSLDLDKIRKLREQKRITQAQMARRLGYKTATGYCYAENGQRDFKPSQLPILAKELGLDSTDELFIDQKSTILVEKDIIKPKSLLTKQAG